MSREFFASLADCNEGDVVQLKGRVRHYASNDHWFIDFGDPLTGTALFFEQAAKTQVVKVLDTSTKL